MRYQILVVFCVLFFAISLCFGQDTDDQYFYQDVFVSCEGDLNLYLKTNIIIYVSDENGVPACNGNFFTVKNVGSLEIAYEAKVLEKYQKLTDTTRVIIATTSNIGIFYPGMGNSKQTIQLIDYRSKRDEKVKVYLSLTLKINKKQNGQVDLTLG